MSSLPRLPLCAVRNTSPTRITLEPLQYKSPDLPLSLSKRASWEHRAARSTFSPKQHQRCSAERGQLPVLRRSPSEDVTRQEAPRQRNSGCVEKKASTRKHLASFPRSRRHKARLGPGLLPAARVGRAEPGGFHPSSKHPFPGDTKGRRLALRYPKASSTPRPSPLRSQRGTVPTFPGLSTAPVTFFRQWQLAPTPAQGPSLCPAVSPDFSPASCPAETPPSDANMLSSSTHSLVCMHDAVALAFSHVHGAKSKLRAHTLHKHGSSGPERCTEHQEGQAASRRRSTALQKAAPRHHQGHGRVGQRHPRRARGWTRTALLLHGASCPARGFVRGAEPQHAEPFPFPGSMQTWRCQNRAFDKEH